MILVSSSKKSVFSSFFRKEGGKNENEKFQSRVPATSCFLASMTRGAESENKCEPKIGLLALQSVFDLELFMILGTRGIKMIDMIRTKRFYFHRKVFFKKLLWMSWPSWDREPGYNFLSPHTMFLTRQAVNGSVCDRPLGQHTRQWSASDRTELTNYHPVEI